MYIYIYVCRCGLRKPGATSQIVRLESRFVLNNETMKGCRSRSTTAAGAPGLIFRPSASAKHGDLIIHADAPHVCVAEAAMETNTEHTFQRLAQCSSLVFHLQILRFVWLGNTGHVSASLAVVKIERNSRGFPEEPKPYTLLGETTS